MSLSPSSAVCIRPPLRALRLTAIILSAVLGVAYFGCRPRRKETDPTAQIAVRFDPAPPTVGHVTLDVILTNAAGEPLPVTDLAVEGDMNHAGMKPVFARLQETAPGHYTGRFHFTMGGDWILLFSGERAGGGNFEKQVNVPGVRAK